MQANPARGRRCGIGNLPEATDPFGKSLTIRFYSSAWTIRTTKGVQAQKRETHGKNCIQVMLKVQSMSHAHAARPTLLPIPAPFADPGAAAPTDTAAVLDSFPAGTPYDPEQVLQPLLIPENPDLEPDTRMPE